MNLSIPRVRNYLMDCELEALFVEELGWSRHSGEFSVDVGEETFVLRALAELKGVQIFECHTDPNDQLPDYPTRQKIEKQAAKLAHEHLIIFVNADRTEQRWQWVAREQGRPPAYREYLYTSGQPGDGLIQKLNTITFSIDEAEGIDLVGTVIKMRDAFDRDKVTKRFYDHFKRVHAAFFEIHQRNQRSC